MSYANRLFWSRENGFCYEASGSPGHPVHKKLLENETVIVEGLNLADVKGGNYEIIVLPLKLEGLDGSPARAVLIQD
ncbi:MAG: hypothetical protein A2Z11_02385 [Candidatus Woykebacteria bacterium RBG_16_43_9]|uniref:Cyclase n=1 Tax=Candidatus Woykebacteria bacterium RBG_16_43_9 TaxID=1802596 RepID=A0A1G1WGM7_9BACT|nr:MAG: hypothetical protein A2Z11_02385 [Candidatus Woykebacteria bacterium RBG_16_43_9]